MNKYFLITTTLLIFVCIGLSGCTDDMSGIQKTDSKLDKFIGTWSADQGITIVFNHDKTCKFAGMSGIWEVINDTLSITIIYEDGKNMMSYTYQFLDDKTTLVLTDAGDRTSVFTKQ